MDSENSIGELTHWRSASTRVTRPRYSGSTPKTRSIQNPFYHRQHPIQPPRTTTISIFLNFQRKPFSKQLRSPVVKKNQTLVRLRVISTFRAIRSRRVSTVAKLSRSDPPHKKLTSIQEQFIVPWMFQLDQLNLSPTPDMIRDCANGILKSINATSRVDLGLQFYQTHPSKTL